MISHLHKHDKKQDNPVEVNVSVNISQVSDENNLNKKYKS